VTFRETSASSTPAVQYWFYPGETIGKEFIYPKDQAMRIARRTGAAVLTEDGRVTADAQASAGTQLAPAQEQGAVAVRGEGIGVVEGSGLPEPEPEPQATTGTAQAQDELPQTASPLATAGLLAVLSLAGAVAFRRFRR